MKRTLEKWQPGRRSSRRPARREALKWLASSANFLLTGPFNTLADTPTSLTNEEFFQRLNTAALARTKASVRYDPAYVPLDYPGGDVPADTGVCTDVVIRSYRALGVDLQVLVHEDMRAHFSKYPKNWGLGSTDRNIDHRRVPDLQTYFERQGAALPVSDQESDYLPGDLVAWDLNGRNLWHIGVVVDHPDRDTGGWIVHNIGSGPRLERRLFDWEIVGHYRFRPARN